MEDIVKIDKNDIKEMVNSCVNRILCEDACIDEAGRNTYYLYRTISANTEVDAIYFITDNYDFGMSKVADDGLLQNVYVFETLAKRDPKFLDAGEKDLSEIPDSEAMDYIFSPKLNYDVIEFYPNNVTSCYIVSGRRYSVHTQSIYANNKGNKNKIDLSTIKFVTFREGENREIGVQRKEGNILCNIGDENCSVGKFELSIYGSPTFDGETQKHHIRGVKSEIAYELGFWRDNNAVVKNVVRLLDFNKKTCVIRLRTFSGFRNCGVASTAIGKIMAEFGEHCHYLVFSATMPEDPDDKNFIISNRLANKYGFKEVYSDDKNTVYYK